MRLIAIHICNVLSVCVCLCICVFDTLVTPAKTDELIIMSFEMWTRGSFPKNQALFGGRDPPTERDTFGGHTWAWSILSAIFAWGQERCALWLAVYCIN